MGLPRIYLITRIAITTKPSHLYPIKLVRPGYSATIDFYRTNNVKQREMLS